MKPSYEGGCAFLDRDGTIIVERHYLSDPDGVELLPDAAVGIRALRRSGMPVVVISNQPGIGRGLYDADAVERVNARMVSLLEAEGVTVDRIYLCPHTPEDGCACRKPAPGLVYEAARDLLRSPARSIVVGDKRCDVELGAAVGATTVLVRTGYGAETEREPGIQVNHVIDTLGQLEEIVACSARGRVA